jgi:predicted RecB family nuclease
LPSLTSQKKWDLHKAGKKTIASLDEKNFKGVTQKAIRTTKSKKIEIEKATIQKEISKWNFPFYFFDFETLGPAIPRYAGTKPYAAIPFQFSCHVLSSINNQKLEHFEYLHTEPTDPRPAIIQALLKGIGKTGSIVAYNKSFEIAVIKKLAEFDSKNKKKLLALIDRFVDPLPVFKQAVYHFDFLGSFSIKSVAPAILGQKLQYDDLEISDGSQAQAVADQMLQGKISSPDKEKYIEQLLTYCRQDTMAMVELVRWLFKSTQTTK